MKGKDHNGYAKGGAVKRADGGALGPRRPGDPVPGTMARPKAGGTGGGLNRLPSESDTPAPITPPDSEAGKRRLIPAHVEKELNLAKGGFVPFGKTSAAKTAPPKGKRTVTSGLPPAPTGQRVDITKGGVVKKYKGGAITAESGARKRLKAQGYAKGGIVGYADGGDVSLWERLKAGNIDDPSSEAYRRWGKGAQEPAASLGGAPIATDSATPPVVPPAAIAPTAPPVTPAAVAAMPPPREMSAPPPKARPKPKAGKGKGKGTPASRETKNLASRYPAPVPDTGDDAARLLARRPPQVPPLGTTPIQAQLRGIDADAAAAAATADETANLRARNPLRVDPNGPQLEVQPYTTPMKPPGAGRGDAATGGADFGEIEDYEGSMVQPPNSRRPVAVGGGRGSNQQLTRPEPMMQPPFGPPTRPPINPLAAEIKRRMLLQQAAGQIPKAAGGPVSAFAKGGGVKVKSMGTIKPATAGAGPAKAAEHTKVPTFAPGKPAALPGRLHNDVAKPFGASHATPVPSSTRGPVKKKFI